MSNYLNLNPVMNKDRCKKFQWAVGCFGYLYSNSDKLSIIREEMMPHTSETPHYHNIAQQFFYILKGKALFNLDDKNVELVAGDSLHVPPKKIHCIKNESPDILEFLVISEPHAHRDRVQLSHTKN